MISMYIYIYMVGGIPTPEFVSWDHDIPNWMEKMFQTTNQIIS